MSDMHQTLLELEAADDLVRAAEQMEAAGHSEADVHDELERLRAIWFKRGARNVASNALTAPSQDTGRRP